MRFATLGTGFYGREYHLPGLLAHPDAELVGVWGRNPDKARDAAESVGTEAFEDLDALLDRVDAVTIATAPDAQPELAIRAARAGCHLLLEKPVAVTVEDAERVVAEIERAGVASIVNLSFLWNANDWVSEVRSSRWDGGSATILTPLLSEGGPFEHSTWRRDYGALWDAGSHALSMLVAALGPVTDVSARRGHGDVYQISLAHQDGGVSTVLTGFAVPPGTHRFECWLWGENGMTSHAATDPDPFAAAVTELVRAADTGTPHPWDARFGADLVRVLAAAERFADRPVGERSERP